MRKLIAASLLVLPTLMHAQQGSSKMLAAAAVTPKINVFSGMIAPERINNLDMATFAGLTSAKPIKVSYTVDAEGFPKDIQVLEAPNAAISAKAVEAVSKLRYHPGKLNGQAVNFPVIANLTF